MTRGSVTATSLALGVVLALGPSGRAAAQDEALTSALALYEAARFAEAIDELENALQRLDLSSGGVETALDRIAVGAFALGRADAVDDALYRLAVVAPSHAFGLDVPPPIVDRFAAIAAEPLGVELVIDSAPVLNQPTRARFSVRAEGPGAIAVRAVVLRCGAGGPSHVTRSLSPELVEPLGARCVAEAEGPGGLPIARAVREGEIVPEAEVLPPTEPGTSGVIDPVIVGLLVGGGLVVVGVAIGIGVAVGSSSSGPAPGTDATVTFGVRW